MSSEPRLPFLMSAPLRLSFLTSAPLTVPFLMLAPVICLAMCTTGAAIAEPLRATMSAMNASTVAAEGRCLKRCTMDFLLHVVLHEMGQWTESREPYDRARDARC